MRFCENSCGNKIENGGDRGFCAKCAKEFKTSKKNKGDQYNFKALVACILSTRYLSIKDSTRYMQIEDEPSDARRKKVFKKKIDLHKRNVKCCIKDCTNTTNGPQRLCNKHYARKRKHGDVSYCNKSRKPNIGINCNPRIDVIIHEKLRGGQK